MLRTFIRRKLKLNNSRSITPLVQYFLKLLRHTSLVALLRAPHCRIVNLVSMYTAAKLSLASTNTIHMRTMLLLWMTVSAYTTSTTRSTTNTKWRSSNSDLLSALLNSRRRSCSSGSPARARRRSNSANSLSL